MGGAFSWVPMNSNLRTSGILKPVTSSRAISPAQFQARGAGRVRGFSNRGLYPTEIGLNRAVGEGKVQQAHEQHVEKNKSDHGECRRQGEFFLSLEVHVGKHDDRDRDGKTDQPAAHKKADEPGED